MADEFNSENGTESLGSRLMLDGQNLDCPVIAFPDVVQIGLAVDFPLTGGIVILKLMMQRLF